MGRRHNRAPKGDNLRSAKALELSVPPALLALANDMIE